MPLEYKSQIGLEAIMPVLDEYVVWYGRLVRSYFEARPADEKPPGVFMEWLEKAKAEGNISPNMAERVSRIHADMWASAREFTNKFAARDVPPLKEYNELSRHYEEFIQMMRRMELDEAVENSGFDERTGLRSVKLLKDDVSREMERRARRGNPFSLALVKINGFKEEWRDDDETFYSMVRQVSEQIKEVLRSFDDAYFLGGEYFLLCLKHADMVGSQAAIARLNMSINSTEIAPPDAPKEQISVSTVVSEPTQGDNLENMLENMKKDLVGIDSKGTVVQYNDISPLQRYIHSMGKDK